MLETMLAFNLTPHLWEGTKGPANELGYPRALSPYRIPYKTKDGMVCVLAHTDEQWHRLLRAIGRPDLIEDTRFTRLAERAQNIATLQSYLAEELAKFTTEEAFQKLDEADLPNGPVAKMNELMVDPYLQKTNFFQKIEDQHEDIIYTTAPPVDFSDSPASVRSAAPALGEHSEEILLGAGISQHMVNNILKRGR